MLFLKGKEQTFGKHTKGTPIFYELKHDLRKNIRELTTFVNLMANRLPPS